MGLYESQFLKGLVESQKAARMAKSWQGRPFGSQRGIVVDVDDPQNLGRVKVRLDCFTPGSGEGGYQSQWVPTLDSFNGKQPPTLIGQRVVVDFSNADFAQGVVNSIVYDEGSKGPNMTSTMTRLPVYPFTALPPPSPENIGCMCIATGSPMGDLLMVVMTPMGGGVQWVGMCPFLHIHGGQATSHQDPDSDGDQEQPIVQEFDIIYDTVTPTWANPIKGQKLTPGVQ